MDITDVTTADRLSDLSHEAVSSMNRWSGHSHLIARLHREDAQHEVDYLQEALETMDGKYFRVSNHRRCWRFSHALPIWRHIQEYLNPPVPGRFSLANNLGLVSMGASYDSRERDPAPRCLAGTRREVLEVIETWVKTSSRSKSILWLHGPPGAGKSAIAQTVAETCAERNELAASFFFARTVAGRNSLKHLFPTIAVQIALSAPDKRWRLNKILKKDPCTAERASGSVDLVAALFEKRSPLVPSSPFLVIIDGLDECNGRDDQRRALEQVSHMVNTHRLPLRFLIVSRPEAHLCEAFEEQHLADVAGTLSLYGDFQARDDVYAYLKSEFSRIYDSKRHRDVMEFVPRPWPSEDVIDGLASNSGSYFIYASTVIRFVDEENFSPVERLDQILNISNPAVPPSDSAPFAELDKLYLQILSSCPTSSLPILKRILGFVVNHSRGVDILVIEALFHLPRGQVKLMLRGLRSLVLFLEFCGEVHIHPNHASFGEFPLSGTFKRLSRGLRRMHVHRFLRRFFRGA